MGDWSQAGQGAAGGAMAGGAIGGPIGGLIGGALGGLGGYFGGSPASSYQGQLQTLADQYGNRQAPQAGAASQSAYSDFRNNQTGLISMLQGMANGTGPSAASLQMREAMDRAAGAQASAAAGAGGRGVNAGAAYRNAANNTAAVQAQGARDTGLMRVQEQLGATNQLGQVVGQARGQDEGNNQFNAGQNNATNLANLQAKLTSLGINTDAQLKALMGAIGAAGPGLGTQILAGGASMMPSFLGGKGQGNVQQQPGTPASGFSQYTNGGGPVTNPGQV